VDAQKPTSIEKIFASLVLISSFFLFILFAYPGFMSADSFFQLNEAIRESYSKDQAVMMSWLWHSLLAFSPSKAPQLPLLILHTLAYQIGIFLFFQSFFPKKILINATYVLFLSFFPPLLGSLGNIWKDIGQLCSWTLALGVCTYFYKNNKKSFAILFSSLFFFYGMSVRHNSPPTLFPIFLWLVHGLKPTWPWFKKICISSVCLVFMFICEFLELFHSLFLTQEDRSCAWFHTQLHVQLHGMN
jgi:hypothetical protein